MKRILLVMVGLLLIVGTLLIVGFFVGKGNLSTLVGGLGRNNDNLSVSTINESSLDIKLANKSRLNNLNNIFLKYLSDDVKSLQIIFTDTTQSNLYVFDSDPRPITYASRSVTRNGEAVVLYLHLVEGEINSKETMSQLIESFIVISILEIAGFQPTTDINKETTAIISELNSKSTNPIFEVK